MGRTHRLNITPYGPAGTDEIPNGARSITHTRERSVDKTDDTRTNDCWVSRKSFNTKEAKLYRVLSWSE